MSIVAGVYNETLVQNLWKKAKEVAMDSRTNLQFQPNIEVLNHLAKVQGGQLLAGGSPGKDYDVYLRWDNFCEIAADDNETCAFPTTKSSTNAKGYNMTWLKQAGFTLYESDFDNNMAMFEEHFAQASLKCEIALLEAFAQYSVGRLNTFAGVNQVAVGMGTVVDTLTYIPPTWNFDVVPYLHRVATINKMANPIFLSGNNLYEPWWKAQFQAGDTSTPKNLFGQMQMLFDLFNIDTVNAGDLMSYLVGQGSVAFLNKTYNPASVETSEVGQRWSVNSVLFPQFKFDVFKKTTCETRESGVDRWITQIKYVLKADLVANPTGCNEDNTNVLAFMCEAAPGN